MAKAGKSVPKSSFILAANKSWLSKRSMMKTVPETAIKTGIEMDRRTAIDKRTDAGTKITNGKISRNRHKKITKASARKNTLSLIEIEIIIT